MTNNPDNKPELKILKYITKKLSDVNLICKYKLTKLSPIKLLKLVNELQLCLQQC